MSTAVPKFSALSQIRALRAGFCLGLIDKEIEAHSRAIRPFTTPLEAPKVVSAGAW